MPLYNDSVDRIVTPRERLAISMIGAAEYIKCNLTTTLTSNTATFSYSDREQKCWSKYCKSIPQE